MKTTISFIFAFMMTVCALAQDVYVGSLYLTTTDEEKLYGDGNDKWSKRLVVLGDIFNFEQPDVLGLQGGTTTQMNSLYRKLTGYRISGDIIYNSRSVQLDTCNVVEEMPEGSTCTWVKMRKGEKEFYVFNVSFSTNTTTAASSATRVLSAIRTINADNLPCFIVGYLGGNQTKSAYTRLANSYYDCYTKAPIVSAEYGTLNNFDPENNHSNDRYDFVFVSKTGINIKAYGQLEYAYLTSQTEGYKRRLPSTHFPVMVKARL